MVKIAVEAKPLQPQSTSRGSFSSLRTALRLFLTCSTVAILGSVIKRHVDISKHTVLTVVAEEYEELQVLMS